MKRLPRQQTLPGRASLNEALRRLSLRQYEVRLPSDKAPRLSLNQIRLPQSAGDASTWSWTQSNVEQSSNEALGLSLRQKRVPQSSDWASRWSVKRNKVRQASQEAPSEWTQQNHVQAESPQHLRR